MSLVGVKSVGVAADVEDVAVVGKTVEDGGGNDIVPRRGKCGLLQSPKFKAAYAAAILLAVLAVATGCGGGSAQAQFTLTMPTGPCTPATLTGVVTNASNQDITVNPGPKIHLDGRTFTSGGSGTCSKGSVTSIGSGGGPVVFVNPSSEGAPPSPVVVFPQHSFQFTIPYGIPASLCGTQGWLTEPAFGRVAITFACSNGG